MCEIVFIIIFCISETWVISTQTVKKSKNITHQNVQQKNSSNKKIHLKKLNKNPSFISQKKIEMGTIPEKFH